MKHQSHQCVCCFSVYLHSPISVCGVSVFTYISPISAGAVSVFTYISPISVCGGLVFTSSVQSVCVVFQCFTYDTSVPSVRVLFQCLPT